MKIRHSFLLSFLVCSGCASIHEVSINNFTQERLNDVHIKTASENFDFSFGTLIPNITSPIGQAGYGGPMKINQGDICSVTWVDSAGKSHNASIDMKSQSWSGHNPIILFNINQDGSVSVKFVKD